MPSQDLEYLIEKTVDPAKADYAVIVGVQVHNWAAELVPEGEVSLEFVAPSKAYAVVNGVKTFIALSQVPVRLSVRASHPQFNIDTHKVLQSWESVLSRAVLR